MSKVKVRILIAPIGGSAKGCSFGVAQSLFKVPDRKVFLGDRSNALRVTDVYGMMAARLSLWPCLWMWRGVPYRCAIGGGIGDGEAACPGVARVASSPGVFREKIPTERRR